MKPIGTVTNYMQVLADADRPGTYEFYEVFDNDPIKKCFIIKNIISNKSTYIKSDRNKLEINDNFKNFNNLNIKKISVISFFQKINGLGVTFI